MLGPARRRSTARRSWSTRARPSDPGRPRGRARPSRATSSRRCSGPRPTTSRPRRPPADAVRAPGRAGRPMAASTGSIVALEAAGRRRPGGVEAARPRDPRVLRRPPSRARGLLAGFSLRDSAEFDDWRATQAVAAERSVAAVLDRLADSPTAAATSRRHRCRDPPPRPRPARRGGPPPADGAPGEVGRPRRGHPPISRVRRRARPGLAWRPWPRRRSCTRPSATRGWRSPPGERRVDRGGAAVPEAIRGAATLPMVGRAAASSDPRGTAHGGRGGALVLVSGEAGIGKSRLVDAVAEAVRADGGRVLQARAYAAEVGIAYGPIVELLRVGLAGADAVARLAALPPGRSTSWSDWSSSPRACPAPGGRPRSGDDRGRGSGGTDAPDRSAGRRRVGAGRGPASGPGRRRGRPVGGRLHARDARLARPPARRSVLAAGADAGDPRTSTTLAPRSRNRSASCPDARHLALERLDREAVSGLVDAAVARPAGGRRGRGSSPSPRGCRCSSWRPCSVGRRSRRRTGRETPRGACGRCSRRGSRR